MGFALYDIIIRAMARARTTLVRSSFADFGARSVIFAPVRLAGVEHVKVGNGVYIGSGCWIQGGPDPERTADSHHVPLKIGNRVSISGNTTISAVRSVQIGNDVLIASGVFICDHTHQTTGIKAIRDQGITGIAPVSIGAGSWIGQNVVIMPGVSIGEGAVIGANSVVTKDVPSRTIAFGTPASIYRGIDPAS